MSMKGKIRVHLSKTKSYTRYCQILCDRNVVIIQKYVKIVPLHAWWKTHCRAKHASKKPHHVLAWNLQAVKSASVFICTIIYIYSMLVANVNCAFRYIRNANSTERSLLFERQNHIWQRWTCANGRTAPTCMDRLWRIFLHSMRKVLNFFSFICYWAFTIRFNFIWS